jgi:hypothetical protein
LGTLYGRARQRITCALPPASAANVAALVKARLDDNSRKEFRVFTNAATTIRWGAMWGN